MVREHEYYFKVFSSLKFTESVLGSELRDHIPWSLKVARKCMCLMLIVVIFCTSIFEACAKGYCSSGQVFRNCICVLFFLLFDNGVLCQIVWFYLIL